MKRRSYIRSILNEARGLLLGGIRPFARLAPTQHAAGRESSEAPQPSKEQTLHQDSLLILLLKWSSRRTRHFLWQNKSLLLLLIPVLIYLPLVLWMAFPSQIAVVMSDSMEPTLKTGDLVILSPAKNIQVGDIVAFDTPGGNPGFPDRLIHRVAEFDEAGARLTTKGDANDDADPFAVGLESVLGVQKYRVPYGGYIILFLQSRYGKIWMAIVALVFVYPTLARMGVWTRRSLHKALTEGLMQGVSPQVERLEKVETCVNETRETMGQFSKAIAEYATHLQSHTAAVRGMSQGSQELVSAVQTQNEVLARLKETLDYGTAPRVKRSAQPAPKIRVKRADKALQETIRTYPPGHYRGSR